MKIDWLVVLRDTLMVVVLASLGTLGISVFLLGSPMWTGYLAAMIMLIGGFTISGSLKGAGRFTHLSIVAVGVWVVALLNGWLREPERIPATVVVGLPIIFLAMLAGGLISLVIRKSTAPSAPPPD